MTDPFHPRQLDRIDRDRRDNYTKNLLYFEGKQWPKRRDSLRRLTLNYARSVVHKTAAHVAHAQLQITPPAATGDVTTEAQTRAEQAEQALQDIAWANQLDRLDYDAEVDCSVLGDGAWKITYEDGKGVIISAPDVTGIFAWPHPTDPYAYRAVAQRYPISPDDALTLYGAAVSGRGRTQVTEYWTDERWDLFVNESPIFSLPNPYGFVPYIIYPNESRPKQQWGESDLAPLFDVLNELNRELSTLSLIMEFSGNPIAVLTGVTDANDIEATPGAIWTMPAEAKAALLDLLSGGGVRLHDDYLNKLYQALHDLSEIPRTAFAGTERQLSGVALEIELRPLTQKVERKRIIRHAVLQLRARYSLALLDQFTKSDHSSAGIITVAAVNPVLPSDDDAAVRREATAIAADATSHRSALRRLSADDPEAEWQQIVEERRDLAAVAPAPPKPPAS